MQLHVVSPGEKGVRSMGPACSVPFNYFYCAWVAVLPFLFLSACVPSIIIVVHIGPFRNSGGLLPLQK